MSKSKTISFRISPEEFSRMVQVMTPEMKWMSCTDLIREALNAYLGERVFMTGKDVWSE